MVSEELLAAHNLTRAEFESSEFHPMRDCIFSNMLTNTLLAKTFVEAVTGETCNVRKVVTQYNESSARRVKLDVEVRTKSGLMADIEIQVKYKPSQAERAYYIGAMLTSTYQLAKGDEFDKLRPVRVIFVNLEPSAEQSLRAVSLLDENTHELYTDVLRIFELNITHAGQINKRNYLRIFSLFLCYGSNDAMFKSVLEKAGIRFDNPLVDILLSEYGVVINKPEIKERVERGGR
ncbi:hypothetical protein FACS1894188_07010 [Clostridia bacterium]|nr:hypothetical protein FACS1894188_07010 [Clostridia bacterium]